MWRMAPTTTLPETHFLDQVIEHLEADEALVARADAMMESVASMEPLVLDTFNTPQDVRYHAEGPFVRAHVRQILIALYGIVEGKISLLEIEELRRLKGYEGEIQELEETIKEHAALFEVFALCHDVGKRTSIVFDAPEGSRGAAEGFVQVREDVLAHTASDRLAKLNAYTKLFKQFVSEQDSGSLREHQAAFYLQYQIKVHYPNHGKKIVAPVNAALLERMCLAHRLPVREHDLLIDLIAHHMEAVNDFQEVRPKRVGVHVALAKSHGFDPDDYIDLMQGALLLDAVFGSKRLSAHGYWHDVTTVVQALRSEHDWAPHRRGEKADERAQAEKRERNKLFREAGLDGEALLELLAMDPGPEFGIVLRRIQAAVVGKGNMPNLDKKTRSIIEDRMAVYYRHAFKQGE